MGSRQKILLLEGIHPVAKEKLEAEDFEVDLLARSLGIDELSQKLQDYNALGIRSKTQVTADVLKANSHLKAIGTFCIGTNQVELEQANGLGIPVFNAPYSNTRSVAELVLAEVVVLSRQIGDRSKWAHQGQWKKSAAGSHEIRGKTLGIIGYGHIGSQVSVLAESFGLKVIFYDIVKKLPLGNAVSKGSLEELLRESDFVTLHVPETPMTRNMIQADELRIMKKGAYLMNLSRGTVVDIPALAEAVKSGHLGGAAVDVFPVEPKSNEEGFTSELQGLNNVILTPHIGGSTEEAQEAIGHEVAQSLTGYFKWGSSAGAVNFPKLEVSQMKSFHRITNVHKNVPGVLKEINGIVSDSGVNILGQFLATDPNIGYLIIDTGKGAADDIAAQIKALPTSIKTRVLK